MHLKFTAFAAAAAAVAINVVGVVIVIVAVRSSCQNNIFAFVLAQSEIMRRSEIVDEEKGKK